MKTGSLIKCQLNRLFEFNYAKHIDMNKREANIS